jgi:hypothetical protein
VERSASRDPLAHVLSDARGVSAVDLQPLAPPRRDAEVTSDRGRLLAADSDSFLPTTRSALPSTLSVSSLLDAMPMSPAAWTNISSRPAAPSKAISLVEPSPGVVAVL